MDQNWFYMNVLFIAVLNKDNDRYTTLFLYYRVENVNAGLLFLVESSCMGLISHCNSSWRRCHWCSGSVVSANYFENFHVSTCETLGSLKASTKVRNFPFQDGFDHERWIKKIQQDPNVSTSAYMEVLEIICWNNGARTPMTTTSRGIGMAY